MFAYQGLPGSYPGKVICDASRNNIGIFDVFESMWFFYCLNILMYQCITGIIHVCWYAGS